MNTPDKIYLNTPKIQPELDNTTWDTKTYADCENVEYIRKGALLAFLNERRKGLTSGDSFVAGERKILREIIEKIETL